MKIPLPEISIAMATCNGETYLQEQLDSLMTQELPPAEIVICDDASTDGTAALIQAFSQKHPGLVKFVINPKRLGCSKNFEQAISMTTGDFIFLSDQDDVWLPGKISTLMSVMRGSRRPCGAFCNSLLVDRELRSLEADHWHNRGFSSEAITLLNGDSDDKLDLFLKRVPGAGHDMAFPAEYKKILLPFPDLPDCHDTWIGLVLATLNVWRLIDMPLTLFRQHEMNFSCSGRKTSMYREWKDACDSIRTNTFSWNAELYTALLKRVSDHCSASVVLRLTDRRDHSAARARMRENRLLRLRLVIQELRNGRYFRYGRGWKSVLQDILLRELSCGK